jgi:predicted HicB family RNase H-like nuclease
VLTYKGYHGQVEFDPKLRIFHGRVTDTRDVITFEGTTVDEIEESLRDSVDAYLDLCAEKGKEPDRPFSGRLMLRLSPDLHRRLYEEARERGSSLNQLITEKLDRAS